MARYPVIGSWVIQLLSPHSTPRPRTARRGDLSSRAAAAYLQFDTAGSRPAPIELHFVDPQLASCPTLSAVRSRQPATWPPPMCSSILRPRKLGMPNCSSIQPPRKLGMPICSSIQPARKLRPTYLHIVLASTRAAIPHLHFVLAAREHRPG
jgi:hypothetical protein